MRKKKESYRPWIIRALVEAGGSEKLDRIASLYDGKFGSCANALSARRRLRQAVEVLAEHDIAKMCGDTVSLVATYTKAEEPEIKHLCTESINTRESPPPKVISGGLPELGKRR